MNSTQRDRLLTIIDNDSEIQNAYVYPSLDGTPMYCIIGGIMVDIGMDVNQDLVVRADSSNFLPGIPNIAFIADLTCASAIANEFGITIQDLTSLQSTNDNDDYKDRTVRQGELKALVNLIYNGEQRRSFAAQGVMMMHWIRNLRQLKPKGIQKSISACDCRDCIQLRKQGK